MRLVIILTISLFISACTGTRPSHLGAIQTSIQPCPDSPNCVTSNTELADEEHYIEAIIVKATAIKNEQDPSKELIKLISNDPQAEIVIKSPHYIYAEYTSAVFGFVDDVELLFDNKLGRFDVRSASRLGYRDFSANRKRIEALRKKYFATKTQ